MDGEMRRVIERKGHDIADGVITYHDVESTYEAAESLAGHRLDRRKNYAIIDGSVHEEACWSQACSGCYEGYDSFHAAGHGCGECGYTGRVRQGSWVPLEATASRQ